jgi:hypothetical protein
MTSSASCGSGIEDFPFTYCGPDDCSDNVATALELLWSDYNDILGNTNIVEDTTKFDLLCPLGAFNRHNDEQVHIAVGVGCATSL